MLDLIIRILSVPVVLAVFTYVSFWAGEVIGGTFVRGGGHPYFGFQGWFTGVTGLGFALFLSYRVVVKKPIKYVVMAWVIAVIIVTIIASLYLWWENQSRL